MTEYWVSQGNKWCDFCKIYISNNPLSIRTHELGQRHKDSVTKRLASMRKENAAKEKELKESARAFEQIEAKAKRSYQKDLAAFRETGDAVSSSQISGEDAACRLSELKQDRGSVLGPKKVSRAAEESGGEKHQSGPPPGLVVPISSKKPMLPSSYKGTPSSIAVSKRKRPDEKHKAVSKDETEALRAREAAKKRMEEREKPLLGLYRSY